MRNKHSLSPKDCPAWRWISFWMDRRLCKGRHLYISNHNRYLASSRTSRFYFRSHTLQPKYIELGIQYICAVLTCFNCARVPVQRAVSAQCMQILATAKNHTALPFTEAVGTMTSNELRESLPSKLAMILAFVIVLLLPNRFRLVRLTNQRWTSASAEPLRCCWQKLMQTVYKRSCKRTTMQRF